MVSIPRISKGQKQGFSRRFKSRPQDLKESLGNALVDTQQSEVAGCVSTLSLVGVSAARESG